MARYTTITVPAGENWTPATVNSATTITLQNQGDTPLLVKVTATNVAPTDDAGAIILPPYDGRLAEPITNLAPGVTGAAWVWLRRPLFPGLVMVSHD